MDNYQSPTMEYAAGDFQSENQRITTVIPVVAYRRSPHKKGMYTKNKYIYDYDKDIYICPNNVALIYKEFFNKLKTTYNVSGLNFIWEFKGMGIILKNL